MGRTVGRIGHCCKMLATYGISKEVEVNSGGYLPSRKAVR